MVSSMQCTEKGRERVVIIVSIRWVQWIFRCRQRSGSRPTAEGRRAAAVVELDESISNSRKDQSSNALRRKWMSRCKICCKREQEKRKLDYWHSESWRLFTKALPSRPSSAAPGTRSDLWSRCFTFFVFLVPFLRLLQTRSIFVKRILHNGHVFSRSAHFSMHSKQNRWSQPLIKESSSGSTSHKQMQQLEFSSAEGFFSSSSRLGTGAGGGFFKAAGFDRDLFRWVGTDSAPETCSFAWRFFDLVLGPLLASWFRAGDSLFSGSFAVALWIGVGRFRERGPGDARERVGARLATAGPVDVEESRPKSCGVRVIRNSALITPEEEPIVDASISESAPTWPFRIESDIKEQSDPRFRVREKGEKCAWSADIAKSGLSAEGCSIDWRGTSLSVRQFKKERQVESNRCHRGRYTRNQTKRSRSNSRSGRNTQRYAQNYWNYSEK